MARLLRIGKSEKCAVRADTAKHDAKAVSSNGVDIDLGEPQATCSSKTDTNVVRLARNIDDVLGDTNTLSYFIQYMHSIDSTHLIQFWLHADSFRTGCRRALGDDGTAPPAANVVEMFRQDATNMYSKYIAKDASHSIGLPDAIRETVTSRLCPQHPGSVDADCLLPAAQFVYRLLSQRYFREFRSSVYYSKHLLEFLTQPQPPVQDILADETALCALTEFLEVNGQEQLIEFWLTAEHYRHNASTARDAKQNLDDAMSVYDRYLSLQAPRRVILSESDRIAVENAICREGGPLSTCLYRAQHAALRQIERVCVLSALAQEIVTVTVLS